MNKISTIILSEEFSTNEVLKLFVQEFDNLELIENLHNYNEIFNRLFSIKDKSLLIVDLSNNKRQKLDLILKVSKECKNCKILALSDNPSVDLIIEIMRAGAKEFIPIPIIKNELFEAIKNLSVNLMNRRKIIVAK